MKKLKLLLALAVTTPMVWADHIPFPKPMVLDKVGFQVSAKKWVTTQSALLTVNVNASLSNADLVKAKNDIMTLLGQVASGEWHIIQFDRSQDSSGLDKLFVAAQVRVPQASLTDIYQNAKKVSKPGATYTINAVEFKPSLEEVQAVKAQLRAQLYKLVNDEIVRLNKVYTEQHYSVNTLVVSDGDLPQAPTPLKAYRASENVMSMAAAPAPTLAVSNELVMSAYVEAASNRQRSNQVADSSHQ